jgi:hypothetical protein
MAVAPMEWRVNGKERAALGLAYQGTDEVRIFELCIDNRVQG